MDRYGRGVRNLLSVSGCFGSLGALCAAALSLFWPSAAIAFDQNALPVPFANNYGDLETTRSSAMGGALRSMGSGTTGIFLNPAAMALTRIYHLEGILQATPEADKIMAGGVVVDSVLNSFGLAGGIAVLGGFFDPSGVDWTTVDVRAGMGYALTERFYLGIGPRYANLSQGREDSLPEGSATDERTLYFSMFSLDAGLILKPTDTLFISIVGQNLVGTRRGVYPTTVGGGIGFGTQDFSLEVDGLADIGSYDGARARIMAGGEVLIADHFPLRAGYRFDQGANLHSLSAGVGYVGTEFSIETSVRRSLSSPGTTTIVVGLAYFLESTELLRSALEGGLR